MINGVWKSVGYTFVAGSDATYQVNLAWIAPVDSPVTIAGYNVYRAPSGSSIYEQVNPSVTDATTFIDTNVTSGDAYDYYIESVTSAGVSSAPSAVLGISIP
jgi:fibronectin type 3 domain-containing protein